MYPIQSYSDQNSKIAKNESKWNETETMLSHDHCDPFTGIIEKNNIITN